MKKIIEIIIIVCMVFALCACGSKTNSKQQKEKDDLLYQAEDVLMLTLNSDVIINKQNAKETYCGKILNIQKAIVRDIFDDRVWLDNGNGGDDHFRIEAHLPLEDIKTLEIGQTISVVGRTSEEIESKNDGYENGARWDQITMNEAYVSQDRFIISGKLEDEIEPSAHGWSFSKKNDNGLFSESSNIVYFSNKENTKSLKSKSEITIKGKKIGNVYKDAVIVNTD